MDDLLEYGCSIVITLVFLEKDFTHSTTPSEDILSHAKTQKTCYNHDRLKVSDRPCTELEYRIPVEDPDMRVRDDQSFVGDTLVSTQREVRICESAVA